MQINFRRHIITLIAGTAVTWGMVQAQPQTPPAPAAHSPSHTLATATPHLNIRDVYNRLEAAGYREIREIEWDDGRYEAEASNAQGARVKLYVNASTGTVEGLRLGNTR